MSTPRAAADGVRDLARDVQRFGLLSASSVVERYVDLVDRAVGGAPVAAAPGSSDRPSDPFMDGDMSALVDSATRVAQAYLGLLDAATGPAEPAAPAEGLVLDAAQAGQVTQAPLWVHNPGTEPTGDLTVTMGVLVAADGASLNAASVWCAPARLDGVAPRGSAQLEVRVQVPHDQPAGIYHGFVLVSLAPADPIQVTVEVLAS